MKQLLKHICSCIYRIEGLKREKRFMILKDDVDLVNSKVIQRHFWDTEINKITKSTSNSVTFVFPFLIQKLKKCIKTNLKFSYEMHAALCTITAGIAINENTKNTFLMRGIMRRKFAATIATAKTLSDFSSGK